MLRPSICSSVKLFRGNASGNFPIATLLFVFFVVLLSVPSFARDPFGREAGPANETPKELEDITINEHLGDTVDTNLKFKDESGQDVTLAKYLGNKKPVLLSLAYFSCPSLCTYHVNGLVDSLKAMSNPVGKEFDFVVISIDPRETPKVAAEKKAAYLNAYGRPETAGSWHFLTGQEPEIAAIAKQVGFNYHWAEEQKQYAHASAAYVLTPDGVLSRYFYGIVFDPKELRLSMVEASNGHVGTIVDKLTLFCFHLDPKTNKRTLAAFNVVRAGGALMVLILGAFLVPFWLRRNRLQGDA